MVRGVLWEPLPKSTNLSSFFHRLKDCDPVFLSDLPRILVLTNTPADSRKAAHPNPVLLPSVATAGRSQTIPWLQGKADDYLSMTSSSSLKSSPESGCNPSSGYLGLVAAVVLVVVLAALPLASQWSSHSAEWTAPPSQADSGTKAP
jgi:hypothetical protein